MSKHYDRQIKLQRFFESRFYDLYQQAKVYGWTHEKLLEEERKGIYEHPDYAKLTHASTEYLSGVSATLFKTYMGYEIEGGYYLDGEFVVAGQGKMSGEQARRITELNLPCVSRWKHSGKPF